jgi:hypothetical protein
VVGDMMIFGALMGALWNLITWWLGIPSSSSHGLIGGLAGGRLHEGRTWCHRLDRVGCHRRRDRRVPGAWRREKRWQIQPHVDTIMPMKPA